MYINNCFYQSRFLECVEKKSMPEKMKRYIVDLYRRYKIEPNIDTAALVHNYEQLALQLLNSVDINKCCKQADYLFFPSWGFSFNSDYAVPELHLKNKMGWTGSILDIRDCGKLCVYYAIDVLLKLSLHENVNNIVCFSIENKWPLEKSDVEKHYPEEDYIGFLSLSSFKNESTFIEIVFCEIMNCEKNIDDRIARISEKFLIPSNSYIIYQNSALSLTTSGFLYSCLNFILNNPNLTSFEFIFIIDSDQVISATGIILIKKHR